jgi:uncharacterized protein YcfJ
MDSRKLVLAAAVAAACAAIPGAAQDRPYYHDDARFYDRGDDARYYDRGADWRGRDAYRDDVAQVIDVQPIASTAGQREECWNPRAGHYEEVRGPDKARIASKDTAIGAIAGGVIGHQIDSGAAGTLGGALIGGIAGHAYEQHRNNEQAQDDLDRSRCRVIGDSGNDVQAYDVRYRYRGQEFVARMDHDPGRTLVIGRDVDDSGHPL